MIKRDTLVHVEEHGNVWTHKEGEADKWSAKGDGERDSRTGSKETDTTGARRPQPETQGMRRKKRETREEGTKDAGQEKTTGQ
ncbi:hypothetical protein NDU88_005923 [Pleurodeles waltl]|uniref:Uncharacterized protein n=1 Tax=Pleurodeles waltl TaxID=8319 RepID=A0AAV7RNI2_PLEWA|nr:hypothetical protein NDU88_005923 [Pleurodeles waltl]